MDHNLFVSKQIVIGRPRETVWRILTEAAYVKQYLYGAELVTDWVVGHPIAFRGEYQGHAWEDRGTVRTFEPPNSLAYTYYSGSCGLADVPENYATVTFQLDARDSETVLTVRQQGYPSGESRASSDAGWDGVLAQIETLAMGA